MHSFRSSIALSHVRQFEELSLVANTLELSFQPGMENLVAPYRISPIQNTFTLFFILHDAFVSGPKIVDLTRLHHHLCHAANECSFFRHHLSITHVITNIALTFLLGCCSLFSAVGRYSMQTLLHATILFFLFSFFF